ncbi:MAG: FKBP-type peptidyl-prolyl cis-trans isomerase [Bacteroidales bacterium]|nr:FKBP-type peptidyl-prolyl cis-trans isomerase [Bacteroidales bacterium]
MAQKDIPLTSELDSVSYSLGIVLGMSIDKAGIKEFNEKLLMQGINEVTGGKQPVLTAEQANEVLNTYLTKLNEKKGVINLMEGQKFLDENGKKEGVVTLPSGLQYKMIKEGEGISPVDTSVVTVHYTGTFINGKIFDSSVERGQPAQFPVNGVIPGWTEALQLMKPGANWILYIPPQLAYGEYGTGGIEPNSVLIFDVELIAVE